VRVHDVARNLTSSLEFGNSLSNAETSPESLLGRVLIIAGSDSSAEAAFQRPNIKASVPRSAAYSMTAITGAERLQNTGSGVHKKKRGSNWCPRRLMVKKAQQIEVPLRSKEYRCGEMSIRIGNGC